MSRSNAKGESREKKPWWETVSGIAGAVVAVAALAGGIWQFASPRNAVSVSIKEGSWTALGEDTVATRDRWAVDSATKLMTKLDPASSGPRFRYAFDLEFTNAGNRSVTMAAAEHRHLTVCATAPRRVWEIGPTIEILGYKFPQNMEVQGKQNNLLQINIRHLRVLGSTTVRVECLSPIRDLGGVFVISRDALFSVAPYPEGYQALELANNLK